MIGTLLTGPLLRVWCDDCTWKRVARPNDARVLMLLNLHPTSGHTGWHDVTEHAFDACAVGAFYPDCSSGAKAGPG